MKVSEESHLDHGLTAAHIAWIVETNPGEGFVISTREMPAHLPALACGLHGPIMGDPPVSETEVTYLRRGDRPAPSRMVGRPARPSRLCTVIGADVLYTAFGGPSAPREPGDPAFAEGKDPDGYAESVAFWKVHALSL